MTGRGYSTQGWRGTVGRHRCRPRRRPMRRSGPSTRRLHRSRSARRTGAVGAPPASARAGAGGRSGGRGSRARCSRPCPGRSVRPRTQAATGVALRGRTRTWHPSVNRGRGARGITRAYTTARFTVRIQAHRLFPETAPRPPGGPSRALANAAPRPPHVRFGAPPQWPTNPTRPRGYRCCASSRRYSGAPGLRRSAG